MSIYAMSDIHGMYKAFVRRVEQLDDLRDIKAGKDKLILLGDYIDVGADSYKVLNYIYQLQQEVGSDNMIVLMGNHEKWFIDFLEGNNEEWLSVSRRFDMLEDFLTGEENTVLIDIINKMEPVRAKNRKIVTHVRECIMSSHGDLIRWMKKLPLYYKTQNQIYVHAGVDEEAGDWWETGTTDEMFIEKFPATTGEFYMDIISGHVSTSTVSGDKDRHDIFYDGMSHYYIDGIDSYPYETKAENRVIPVLIYEERDGKGRYYSLGENGEKMEIRSIQTSTFVL